MAPGEREAEGRANKTKEEGNPAGAREKTRGRMLRVRARGR